VIDFFNSSYRNTIILWTKPQQTLRQSIVFKLLIIFVLCAAKSLPFFQNSYLKLKYSEYYS